MVAKNKINHVNVLYAREGDSWWRNRAQTYLYIYLIISRGVLLRPPLSIRLPRALYLGSSLSSSSSGKPDPMIDFAIRGRPLVKPLPSSSGVFFVLTDHRRSKMSTCVFPIFTPLGT